METNTQPSIKKNVYELVTDQIVQSLEQGTIPWHQPWKESGYPMNMADKRYYKGVNLWLLLSLGYETNLYATFDQLKALNGSVRRGEKGHIVVAPAKKGTTTVDEEQHTFPSLRYYKVFNIAQCTGISDELIADLQQGQQYGTSDCEKVLTGMPNSPVIKLNQSETYYSIEEDAISIAIKKTSKTKDVFYAALFHQLIHSTGHEMRVKRKTPLEMWEAGGQAHSFEELVAELGMAYLCSYAGITYGQRGSEFWIEALSRDKYLFVNAAKCGQQAAEYILNPKRETDAISE